LLRNCADIVFKGEIKDMKKCFFYKVFLLLFLIGFTTACTMTSVKTDDKPKTKEEVKEQADSMMLSANFLGENEKYLYKILVAEIAEQREHYVLASEYFLDIAKWTQDSFFVKRAVQTALQSENYDIALETVNLWLELNPDSFDANQLLIAIFLHQNNIEKAVEHLDIQLSKLGENSGSYLEMFISDIEDSDRALALMKGLATKRASDSTVLLVYARLLMDEDLIEQALPVLDKLFDIDPNSTQTMILYALAFEKQGDVEKTLTWMEKILKKQPDKDEWHLIYARLLVDVERYEEAIIQFEDLLTSQPDNEDFLYALGMLSLQTKKLRTAKKYFNTLAQYEEHIDTAHFYLAQIAELEGNQEKAMSEYKKVSLESTDYLSAQARISMILVKQKQLDKAIEHLHSVETADDEDALKLIQFEAELLTDQKQYERAMSVYNKALKSMPNNLDLLYMRGLLAEKMDRLNQVEQDFRRVLEIDPNHVQAINALGYTLADRTDRYEAAHELIKKALDLRPDDYYILDSMGWVLYRLGDHTKAIEYLRKAESKKHDPEIAAHLGEVLWHSGDHQAAKAVWQKALESFPDDEQLREVVKRLMGSSD